MLETGRQGFCAFMKKKTLVAVLLLISTAVLAQERKDTQSPQAPAKAPADSGKVAPRLPDKAAAYYHYSLAHMYEELVSIYGRAEYATKAIQEYRLAIENDPDSEYLNAGLAELYAKTGRIAKPYAKPRTSSSAIPTTWKRASCWAAFICGRWAICNRGRSRRKC